MRNFRENDYLSALADVYDASTVPVLLCDRALNPVYANAAALALYAPLCTAASLRRLLGDEGIDEFYAKIAESDIALVAPRTVSPYDALIFTKTYDSHGNELGLRVQAQTSERNGLGASFFERYGMQDVIRRELLAPSANLLSALRLLREDKGDRAAYLDLAEKSAYRTMRASGRFADLLEMAVADEESKRVFSAVGFLTAFCEEYGFEQAPAPAADDPLLFTDPDALYRLLCDGVGLLRGLPSTGRYESRVTASLSCDVHHVTLTFFRDRVRARRAEMGAEEGESLDFGLLSVSMLAKRLDGEATYTETERGNGASLSLTLCRAMRPAGELTLADDRDMMREVVLRNLAWHFGLLG